MYFLYILQSQRNGLLYIGVTQNVEKRLASHNLKLQRFTKAYTPWSLIFSEMYKDKQAALKAERKLKSYKNPTYIKRLIIGNKSIASPDLSGDSQEVSGSTPDGSTKNERVARYDHPLENTWKDLPRLRIN